MTQKTSHALFSPSGASKWIPCPGSLALEQKEPNTSSVYAAEGTAAHKVLEWALGDTAKNTRAYLGRIIEVNETDQSYQIEVTEDMCEHVQKVVDNIVNRIEEFKANPTVDGVELLLEERVNFSHIVGQDDQFGTVDVLIIIKYNDGSAALSVEDLKYGQGIAVKAQGNKQLQIYALAAYEENCMFYDIATVDTVIHMARKDYTSSCSYTVDNLLAFKEELKTYSLKGREGIEHETLYGCDRQFEEKFLTPGDHCSTGFCAARAKCPALTKFALRTMIDDFDDLTEDEDDIDIRANVQDGIDTISYSGEITNEYLGKLMEAADTIDDWLRCVRGRVAAELLQGRTVPGFKLVEGRKGNRTWTNLAEAEKVMKSMRLRQDDIYKRTLVSPKQIEDLIGKNVRKWNRIKPLISQSEGKPAVAPESDTRKTLEIKPVIDDFEVLNNCDDLIGTNS